MTDMTPTTEPDLPQSCMPDQLVVHLPHQELILRELADFGAQPSGPAKEDDRLGLALLTLTRKDGTTKITDIDPLLAAVRVSCADKYGGWAPMMGKNRQVKSVFGLPQPKSHALDDLAGSDGPLPIYSTPEQGRGVVVGVVDSKFVPHPALVGKVEAVAASTYDPVPSPVPMKAPHSTFVSSVIIGRAQGASVRISGVLDDEGNGTSWDTVQAMLDFADAGVSVINLSLGCRTADGQPPLLLARAVDVISHRTLLVAAAGNHNLSATPKAPTWPAALPDVVAVGALDMDDKPAEFSPRLPWLTCSAPGVEIVGAYTKGSVIMLDDFVDTTSFGTGYAQWSGTSFATAAVSGVIAARTVPGQVTPREALRDALADADGVVRPWPRCDDGQRA